MMVDVFVLMTPVSSASEDLTHGKSGRSLPRLGFLAHFKTITEKEILQFVTLGAVQLPFKFEMINRCDSISPSIFSNSWTLPTFKPIFISLEESGFYCIYVLFVCKNPLGVDHLTLRRGMGDLVCLRIVVSRTTRHTTVQDFFPALYAIRDRFVFSVSSGGGTGYAFFLKWNLISLKWNK